MRSNNILKYGFIENEIVRFDVDFQVDEKIDIISILLNKIKNNELNECRYEEHCNEKISIIADNNNKDCLACFNSLYNDDIHNLVIDGNALWFQRLSEFIELDLINNRIKIYFQENGVVFCADYLIIKFSIENILTD